ncbi:hypothetical protein [Promicromonospora soli]|uniref:Uncharacterized protein n=1 Tax=Promicromonospora soli TaxID=2035533 RepID=A0A919G1K9_9MICO|nr:hypothetical protein [Promicromonospora soli]GHH76176.1 hypothetical protein GCM10017772_34130 [Promicromonospora soli]
MDPENGPYPARNERPEPDLVAVLLGNATLLGLGYIYLRRWGLALLALAGTALLVIVLAAAAGSAAAVTALAVWWAAMVAHAWWLARRARSAAGPAAAVGAAAVITEGPGRTRSWPRRIVAGAVVVALAATVVGLRVGTAQTVHDAADAHAAGDCERATKLLDRLGPTDRVVYGSKALEGAADLEACGLLLDALALGEQDPPQPEEAAAAVATYMEHPSALWEGAGPRRAEYLLDDAYVSGQVDERALEAGFEQLTTTLDTTPSQAGPVESVAEAFLADLAEDPDDCAARDVVEWVDGQDWSAPELAGPVAAASGEVPRRVLECARTLAATGRLKVARHTYEAFLRDFRTDRRADAASGELYDVVTGLQRRNVRDLLSAGRYCSNPQPYRDASPYRGGGTNPMRVFGISPATHGFPRSWRAHDLDDMVLVACVDGPRKGSYQDTCLYEDDLNPFGSDVSFYASRFDVQLYEVRTGRKVADFSDEFGEPCPPSILVESYTSYFSPPGWKRSSVTSAEIRGMFENYQS